MRTILRAMVRGGATIGCLAALVSGPACNNNPESPTTFATGQFPPVLSDSDYHRDPWTRDDCLVCHEKGRNEAPVVQHRGMAAALLTANCPSCHVLIPGRAARP